MKSNAKLKPAPPALPHRDYPFADMRLGHDPDVDDHSAPGWVEVVYAFLTMLLMALVAYEAMLF